MLAVGLVFLELRWWVLRACQFVINFHSLLSICTPPYLLILHHALPPSALFLRLDQNFESNNGFWSRRRKLFTVWSDWEVFLLQHKYMVKASRVSHRRTHRHTDSHAATHTVTREKAAAISGDKWRLVAISGYRLAAFLTSSWTHQSSLLSERHGSSMTPAVYNKTTDPYK